ncbi:MAG: tail fiber domain-containing protein [Ferruginibacter sp.]
MRPIAASVLGSFILPMLLTTAGFAQSVAINTDGSTANSSALLEIKSTTKGLLIPRMTTAQRNAIPSPAEGLNVFDTNTKTFWFYNGTGWVESATGSPTNYWTPNGTDIFNNNSGNVGIGTNVPPSKLAIKTTINATGWTHTGGNDSIIVNEAIGGVSASLGTTTNHAFRLKTNGLGRLHVLADGRVTVGTNNTQPYGMFTVESAPSDYGISHTDGSILLSTYVGGSLNAAYIGTQTNHSLNFYTNNSGSQMILTTAGNVGIGTTAPVGRLQISHWGPSAHLILEYPDPGEYSRLLFTNTGASRYWGIAGKAGTGPIADDKLSIYNISTGFESLVINGSGGVQVPGTMGIGTTPTAGVRLHINQDLEALRISGNQSFISFFNGANYKGYLWNKGTDDMELGTAGVNTNGKLFLSIKGTPCLQIQSNGQVSVSGSPAPFLAPAFSVRGNGVFSIANSLSEWTFEAINCFSPGGPCLTVYGDGFMRSQVDANGDWVSISDKSLKKDIQAYKPVLTDIQKLNVVTYQYSHNNPASRSFGLIAQNVAAYFPEVVKNIACKDSQPLMGIAYGKVGVLAIKAIQEQQVIIERQQERIENLERKLEQIEKKLGQTFQ